MMETLLLSAWLRMLVCEFAEGMLFDRIYWIPAQFIKMICGFCDNTINLTLSEKHLLEATLNTSLSFQNRLYGSVLSRLY